MKRYLFLNYLFFISAQVVAQIASFNAPTTACLNENITLENTSTMAGSYFWDFCQDGLRNPRGNVANIATVPSNIPVGIEIVYDKGTWYGFICGRDNASNNELIRLSFGNSLNNVPTILTDYGPTINSALFGASEIKFVSINGNWYGLVVNYYSGDITRIDFGTSLDNDNPVIKTLGNPGGWSGPYGLDIIIDNGNYILAVTGNSSNTISFINYGSGLASSNPVVLSVNSVSNSTDALIDSPVKIGIQRSNNNWYALVSSLAGKVVLVDLGIDPMSTPLSISSVANVPAAAALQFKKDGSDYFGFVQNTSGNLFRIDFGATITSSPTLNPLGNFSGVGNTFGLAVVKEWPEWKAFFVGVLSSIVYRLDFDDKCTGQVNFLYSTDENPANLKYTQSGIKTIELATFDISGNINTASSDLIVQNLLAPAPSFINGQNCLTAPINFSSSESSGQAINSWAWDFEDGQTSTLQNPTNQYASTGVYSVTLDVTASNSCTNRVVKEVQIFNSPTASFLLPSGNPLCTNQDLTFSNTSLSDNGSSPIWQWFVNGTAASTLQDLNFTFTSATNQTVKLKASIPGCFTEETQTVSALLAGPNIDFSIVGKCQDETIQFENLTTDAVNGFSWNFGDTQNSTFVSPTHTYSEIGSYAITLTADSPNGCLNSAVKPITIYSKPQPNFSLDLPPFSCAGTLSQFNDLTPAPTDSNISSWNWSFGDVANGTLTVKNPSYTYGTAGSYDVSLKTTTNFGCEATKLKTIQIADPPKAAFTTSATCLNQAAYFTDASSGTNKAWLWKIGNSSYTLQNPAHVFSSTGNYTAQLTVTGNNDCISVLSKPINVPVPPILDFSVQNNCAGLMTAFEDVTVQNADPAVSRVWDFGGKGSGSGASTQFSFPTAGAYSVKLTVTNQSGCNYVLSKNTAIVAAPVAKFTTSVESGPPPLGVQFTNASSNATAYKWEFNDVNNSTSVEVSPSFTYPSLGDFVVDLTASNAQGCIDIESKIIYVIIPYTEIELEEFTLLRDAVTGSVRPVLTIKNNSNYTISNVTVVLDIAGNASVREKINTTILPNASSSQILNYELLPGGSQLNYLCAEVQLTGDVDLVNNSECISLESDEIVFSPYPNPVQEQLSVDWIAATADPIKITIMTQMGQIAYSKNVGNVGVGLNQIVLDLSQLNSGYYIFLFESSAIKKTFPMVIVN